MLYDLYLTDPYAQSHQQPQTNGYAHHPAPTQSHPEPQRTFSPSHSHSQPPPAIQQQAQLDPAEEQQIREYKAKWAEYERQMEEYNRQLAAHQQVHPFTLLTTFFIIRS